jgi:hypothetical protein
MSWLASAYAYLPLVFLEPGLIYYGAPFDFNTLFPPKTAKQNNRSGKITRWAWPTPYLFIPLNKCVINSFGCRALSRLGRI